MNAAARCPGCRCAMTSETRADVTVDRCGRCNGLWFDALELDRCLAAVYPDGAVPPEARIPERGFSVRRCPRCDRVLKTAGWTGLVLDRCPTCRGLFLEASELAQMEREQPPHEVASVEQQLRSAMVSAGWTVLTAQGIALAIIRFLR